MIDRYQRAVAILDRLRWLPLLVARISCGIMFARSGFSKLTERLDEFTALFEKVGIPLASVQAPMVAGIEMLGGALLVVGLATRITSATLIGVMAVAMLTVDARPWPGIDNFLFLPQWLMVLILLWFVFAGAGDKSIDAGIARRLS